MLKRPLRSLGAAVIFCFIASMPLRADDPPCTTQITGLSLSVDETGVTWLEISHNWVNSLTVTFRGLTQNPLPLYNPVRVQLDRSCQLEAATAQVTARKCLPDAQDSVNVPAPDLQPHLFTAPAWPGLDPTTIHVKYSFPANAGSWRIRATMLNTGTVKLDTTQLNHDGSVAPGTTAGDEGKMLVQAWSCNGAAKDTAVVNNEPSDDKCKCPDGQCEPLPQCVGKPVNTMSGGMLYEEVDPIPANSFLPFRRTYLSRRDSAGFFGRRWYSIFDARLSTLNDVDGQQFVTVFTENHEDLTFTLENGVYRQIDPGTAKHAMLVANADGSWTQTDANNRLQRVFSSQGRPIAYRDVRSGRETRLTWASTDPVSVEDSWGNWAWVVAVDASSHLITSIQVAGHTDLTWNYIYDTHLVRVDSPEGTWRTYEYWNPIESASNFRLRVIRDGAGNVIEWHGYETNSGRAISSFGGNQNIDSIEFRQAGRTNEEYKALIHYQNGRTETHYKRFVAGTWRTVQVEGGCSSCGQREGTVAYDVYGNPARVQGSDGYITEKTYDGPSLHVLTERTALRPSDCNPASDVEHCRLDPDELAVATLISTTVTTETSYDYADSHWPDRVTTSTTTSVVDPLGQRVATMTYDVQTGEVLTQTVAGWKRNPSAQETRTTTSTLYNGTEGAAFAPGGGFDSAWLTLPQPVLRKSIDGPRTDVTDVTTFVYYPIDDEVPAEWRGHLAAIRNALGHVTRFEDYDLFGHATKVVDPNGAIYHTTYDTLGRLLSSTAKGIAGCDTTLVALCASDITTTRTYAGAASVSTETHANGVTNYTYDSGGRVSTITRGPTVSDLREQIEYSYDPVTERKSMERTLARENGSWVEKRRESLSYDSFEQLQNLTHADSTSVTYAYDAAGRIASVRDENHAAPNTSYAYDSAGRLETVTQVLGGGTITTAYEYDLHGNLRSVTDPNGNTTEYEYDDFGQMTAQTSPVTGTTTYNYDEAGNVVQSVDANGATTERTYDALGRVLSSVSARTGAATESVDWTYDTGTFGIGRISSMTDPAGQTAYSFDRMGRVVSETRTIAGHEYTTGYRYDADGNRMRTIYPSGRVVDFGFDYAGRPISSTSGATAIVATATYLPFGPLASLGLGNGTTKSLTYDNRYRISNNRLDSAAGTIASYEYGYDDAGNITTIEDLTSGARNRAFGYDDLNRLTIANTGAALWGTGAYSYDDMGNVLEATLGSRIASFSYDGTTPRLQYVSDGESNDIAYDAGGNETSVGSTAFTYSARNHLIAANGLTYRYDGRGVRVATTTAHEVTSVYTDPSFSPGGVGTTGIVTLNEAAPADGIRVRLAANSEHVTVPSVVTIQGGQTEGSFSIGTTAVNTPETVTLVASTDLGNATGTFELMETTLDRMSADARIGGGAQGAGTLFLNGPAPAGGITVALESSDATVTIPPTVTIPEGYDSAAFVLETTAVSSPLNVTITASYDEIELQATVQVMNGVPATVVFSESPLRQSQVSTAFILLYAPAPTDGVLVQLTANHPELLTMPATVLVPEGDTQASFGVTAGGPVAELTTVRVSASYDGYDADGDVAIAPPAVASLTLTPSTIEGGRNVTADVTLESPAAAGTHVDVDGGYYARAAEPATIAAGETHGQTTVQTQPVAETQTVVVDGVLDPNSASAVLTLEPLALTLDSLVVTPAAVVGSNSTTLTVALTEPASTGGLDVEIADAGPFIHTPAYVKVPEGQTSATVEIPTDVVTETAEVQIGGKHVATYRYATLTINPPLGNFVSSLTLATRAVGGDLVTATVTLDAPAGTGGAVVTLASSNSVATVPASVTVAQGSLSATFVVDTDAVEEASEVTIHASYNGVVRAERIMVVPSSQSVVLESLMLASATVLPGDTMTGTVTLSGDAPAGGVVVALDGSRAGIATVPASVTVPEGATTAEFTVTTTAIYGWHGVLVAAHQGAVERTAKFYIADYPELKTGPRSPAIESRTQREPRLGLRREIVTVSASQRLSTPKSSVRTESIETPVHRYFFYTPELNLMAETAVTSSDPSPIEWEYVWFAGQPVAQIESNTGAIAWYFNDHLGAPILQTDASATPIWRIERDPYGLPFTLRTNPARHQPLALPGQEDGGDASYNIFRWYRAGWGRYTQGDRASLPTYTYANTDPLRFIDPLGLYAIDKNGVKEIPTSNIAAACPSGAGSACTLGAFAFVTCTCGCGSSGYVPEPTLHIRGALYYYTGNPKVLKTQPFDKSVTSPIAAVQHEWEWHLNLAIAAVDPIMKELEQKVFSSEQDCKDACYQSYSPWVTEQFAAYKAYTQNAEKNKTKPLPPF